MIPSRLTRILAVSALGSAAISGAAAQETAPQRTDGSTLFRTYCGSCHGAGAQGDGPLAEHLRARPPDLTQIAKRGGGEFPADQVRQIIDGREPLEGHGGGDMPVWGDAFQHAGGGAGDAESRIHALVEYLKSIQRE
jgi:mono/diheme cytochrome c family protein